MFHDCIKDISAAFGFGRDDREVARMFIDAEDSMGAATEGGARKLMEVHNKSKAD